MFAVAGRFISNAIGKRVRRSYEERIVPTLQSRAEQARHEQIAICSDIPTRVAACAMTSFSWLEDPRRALGRGLRPDHAAPG